MEKLQVSNFKGLYDIRDAKESDKAFVLATFLRGLYHDSSWFSLIPKRIFMTNYHPVAEAIVNSPKYVIKVACLQDDPDTIIGYSILAADYTGIVWVFVKKKWRLNGIATTLLPKFPQYVTHINNLGTKLLPKFEGCHFNPFA